MQVFDVESRGAPSAKHCPPAGCRADELPSRAISSARLLLGQPCVTIDHEGTHYVLRATRAGKLILTK